MKTHTFRLLSIAGLAASALTFTAPALAHDGYWHHPGHRVVVVRPAPFVVYRPYPVYYAPGPVVYAPPAPVYYAPGYAPNAVGTIGGAIAGAILGKELGEAHKQHMLTVLGAIGGALAGRQIERQATKSVQYDVDLRLADGTLLKRRYEQPPPFAAGATIRLGTPARVGPAPAL